MNAMKALLAGAVLALSTAGANAATISPTEVISAVRGGCSGTDIQCSANDRLNTENAVDDSAETFYALGLGGQITLGFDGKVFTPEKHVRVTEVTFSRRNDGESLTDRHYEAAKIYSVLDGVETFLGTLFNYGANSVVATGAFDSIKLVDVTKSVFPNTTSYDGFDVGSIAIAPVPLPAAGAMLLAGLGGFAALRRRKNAA